MQWDEMISNQLLSFGGAAVLVLLAGVFAAYRLYKSKPHGATPKQLDGWTPTGRIDFLILPPRTILSCKRRIPELLTAWEAWSIGRFVGGRPR